MFESAFCKVTYDADKNAVLCQWKRFCKGDEYRDPLRYGLELIQQYHPTLWVTDTTHGFESEADDTRWLVEEFLPQTVGSSIENIIFIMRDESPLRDEIEGQAKALREYFDVKIAESLEGKG